MMSPNESAFLDVISHTEGTDRKPDPYRVCYGFIHTIVDLSQHPYPGEWKGEPLDHLGAAYVGKWSTAAGRYQINHPSWLDARILMLPDFSPASQDAWALWKLDALGCSHLIDEGMVNEAFRLASGTWASLPGSLSGQPEPDKMADLIDFYTQRGGVAA
jgi:muramidase (phage lysozyme)